MKTNNEKSQHDNYIPDVNKPWEFNKEVADVFPNMLSRSIPNYEAMRSLLFKVGRNFVKEGTTILDIGCSTGIASDEFIKTYSESNNFVLTDVSVPMLEICKKKYGELIDRGVVSVRNADLRKKLPVKGCSLIISCLTIQFTPIEYRQFIMKNVYDSLEEGGAFIFIEKVLGNSDEIDSMMVKEYYDTKKENSYTEEQIRTKRKSLEGSLVPLTVKMNESLLETSGFKKVDCFWRYLNFMGFIAIK